MIRKLLMLFLLRAAYKHAHRVIDRVGAPAARGRSSGLGRRKPAVKRRRAGWEF